MESISAHALLAILGWDSVSGSLRRHGLVKDRVEARIVSSTGKSLHHFADQGDSRGIMQRGKGHRLLEILEHFVGDSLVPLQAAPRDAPPDSPPRRSAAFPEPADRIL